MEAFFALAGFFSCLVIARKGVRYFLDGRLRRVLVPFAASMLFVTSSQTLFLVGRGLMTFAEVDVGDVVSHLWFLLTLFLLSAALISARFRYFAMHVDLIDRWPALVVFVSCWFVVAALVPKGVILAISWIFPDNVDLRKALGYLFVTPIEYGPYFLVGYILGLNGRLASWVKNVNKAWVFLVVALSAAVLLALKWASLEGGGLTSGQHIVHGLFAASCAVGVIVLLFSFFAWSTFFSESLLTMFMVKSSLVVYLFHQPLLIVFAYYLDIPGLNAYLYYFTVCMVTLLASVSMFFIVDKFSVTRNMFGGWRSMPKREGLTAASVLEQRPG